MAFQDQWASKVNVVNQVLADKKVIKVDQVHRVLTVYQVFRDHPVNQVPQAQLEKKVLLECQDKAENRAYQAYQE
jgi:hypothetical protein